MRTDVMMSYWLLHAAKQSRTAPHEVPLAIASVSSGCVQMSDATAFRVLPAMQAKMKTAKSMLRTIQLQPHVYLNQKNWIFSSGSASAAFIVHGRGAKWLPVKES